MRGRVDLSGRPENPSDMIYHQRGKIPSYIINGKMWRIERRRGEREKIKRR
jgi:hypothetical protein